ncbi:MAG: DUF2142 domain-containing protein [Spirochaetes bacterium]|nr:DUF2142 domain-containing protein [Spirochaetota bacterium]
MAYTFIVPPFQVPDEYMHFARALNLISGNARAIKDGPRMGYNIDCRADYFIRQMPHDGEYKGTGKYRWADFHRVVEEAKAQRGNCFWEIEPGSMQMHVPYLYVPQAIGIFLASKVSPSLSMWLYTGRVFNLVFCVWLLSVALRFMRGSPLRLIYFMSLPMFLHLAGSLSGDAPAISFALLFFSLVIHALSGEGEPTRGFWWITALATFFFGVGKSVYFPVVLLLWLIPLQTKRRADWFRSTAVIGVTLVGLLLWNFLVRNDFYKTPAFPMDPVAQTQWFLAHPLAGIKAVFMGFIVNAHKIAVMYFGVFGWLSVVMPLAWYILYFAVGLLALLLDGGDTDFWRSRWNRPAFVLVPMGVAVLLSLVMFITFTTVGSSHTNGIQGRHLMPFMPFLAWAFFTRGRFAAHYGNLAAVAVGCIVVLHIWALFAIFLQFY